MIPALATPLFPQPPFPQLVRQLGQPQTIYLDNVIWWLTCMFLRRCYLLFGLSDTEPFKAHMVCNRCTGGAHLGSCSSGIGFQGVAPTCIGCGCLSLHRVVARGHALPASTFSPTINAYLICVLHPIKLTDVLRRWQTVFTWITFLQPRPLFPMLLARWQRQHVCFWLVKSGNILGEPSWRRPNYKLGRFWFRFI